MLEDGKRVRLVSGGTTLVGKQFAVGGQAVLYEASTSDGSKLALKEFIDRGRLAEDRQRTEALVALRLQDHCPLLCGPHDMLVRQDLVGHVSRFFEGESLEQFLFPPDGVAKASLRELLFVAALVAHAVAVLHDVIGVSHGDLHPGQFRVRPAGRRLDLAQFDFDNYARSGLPPPAMVGRLEFMAPEVRRAWLSGGRPMPGPDTDLWSLAAVINVILLGRDPGPECDPSSPEFHQGATGDWLDDPRLGDRMATMGGRPARVLNRGLIDLFRKGITPIADRRPRASDWRRACLMASGLTGACSTCGGESVADEQRRRCPYCRVEFPTLRMRCSGGAEVCLDQPEQSVGRAELGGRMTVSEQHCIIRRQPPLTTIQSFGRNGCFVFESGQWIELTNGRLLTVYAGDVLRLADVEVEVVRT